MSAFCTIDNKFVPVYRVLWIAELPHFCGSEDCEKEGQYEVRLEEGESLWAASIAERDAAMATIEAWQRGTELDDDESL